MSAILQPDFQRPARKFQNLGQCLERETTSGKFYARIKIHRGAEPGELPRTYTRLLIAGRTEAAARKNLNHLLDQFDQFMHGRGDNPFARRAGKLTLAELARLYLEAGCPKRDGKPREAKQLDEEKRRVAYLVHHLGTEPWNLLTVEDWHRYRRARAETRTRALNHGSQGNRAVDLEKKTLDAIFRLAILHKTRTGVSENPLPSIRYHHTDQVRHARDVMPASGEELHAIAACLFRDPISQPLAWLMLYQAKIGHRIDTMVQLRSDARPGEPGHIELNDKDTPKILYLVRRNSHKGTHGHRRVDPELRLLIAAHQAWLQANYPGTPWFFPSALNPAKHVDPGSLTGAEERACQILGLPKRTSHGNRAFSINCLRSERTADGFQKIPDAEIAVLHGQKSSKEIIEVYGEAPASKITWTPANGQYAWLTTQPAPAQLDLGL